MDKLKEMDLLRRINISTTLLDKFVQVVVVNFVFGVFYGYYNSIHVVTTKIFFVSLEGHCKQDNLKNKTTPWENEWVLKYHEI